MTPPDPRTPIRPGMPPPPPSTLGSVGLVLGLAAALGMLFGTTMLASLDAGSTYEQLSHHKVWLSLSSLSGSLAAAALAVSIVAMALDRGRRIAIGGLLLSVTAILIQANASDLI